MGKGKGGISVWHYTMERIWVKRKNRKESYRSHKAPSVYRVGQVEQPGCVLISKCVKKK